MSQFLKILAYLLAVVITGALVAPQVFRLGQFLAASGHTDWLAGFPFHRVLSRSIQVSALVLLWPALRWIGLRQLSGLGLQRNTCALRDVVCGVVVSLAVAGVLAAVYLATGLLGPRPDPNWAKLPSILVTAVAVSGIEEFIFRGVVLGVCLWSLRPRGAIALSSLLFAVLHFFKPVKADLAASDVVWTSGFAEVARVAHNLPEAWPLALGLASLFVAGWILGTAAHQTRSLWLPVGLHGGWVFAQQTSNLLLRSGAGDPDTNLPWLGESLVSGVVPVGLLPLLGLLATGWLVAFYLRHVFRPVEAKVA